VTSIVQVRIALAALAVAGLVSCVRGAGEEALISKKQEKETSTFIMSALAASDEPQASAWVYICPDFNTGCSSAAFKVGATCLPNSVPVTPGACFDTGIPISPGPSSSVASCTDTACTTCGTSVSFDTPSSFWQPNFYTTAYFFCTTPCEATVAPSCPPGE